MPLLDLPLAPRIEFEASRALTLAGSRAWEVL
jgi:hypothetical protein